MNLSHTQGDLYIPDGAIDDAAFARTTHLGVGAHQDDLEILAYTGIEACYQRDDAWFGGVVVTDGAGSARQGPYADTDDEGMRRIRREEQRKAAFLGEYAFMAQLGYSSRETPENGPQVISDLERIFRAAMARVVYVHNPVDKHPTHIITLQHAIAALLRLNPAERPEALYGVEVWRDLDWLDDEEKVVLRTDRRPHLAQALIGLFDSQIAGGKRYDLAVPGRRLANATFFNAHCIDTVEAAAFAMDLTPVLREGGPTLDALVATHLQRFSSSVMNNLMQAKGPH